MEQNPSVFNRTILENINYPFKDNNKKILNSVIDSTINSILNQNNKKAGLAGENLSGRSKTNYKFNKIFQYKKINYTFRRTNLFFRQNS